MLRPDAGNRLLSSRRIQAINCQRVDALLIDMLKSRLTVHGLALDFSHALILADEEVELLIRVSERT